MQFAATQPSMSNMFVFEAVFTAKQLALCNKKN